MGPPNRRRDRSRERTRARRGAQPRLPRLCPLVRRRQRTHADAYRRRAAGRATRPWPAAAQAWRAELCRLARLYLAHADDRGRQRQRSLCQNRPGVAPRAALGRALRQRGSLRSYQRRLGDRRLALWTVSARIVTTRADAGAGGRSEEHTSELQSLMRISYAVFCLTKQKITT